MRGTLYRVSVVVVRVQHYMSMGVLGGISPRGKAAPTRLHHVSLTTHHHYKVQSTGGDITALVYVFTHSNGYFVLSSRDEHLHLNKKC